VKLSKEQIESMHTLLVRERPMGTSVAAVDELIRLALLGLEHDRIVAERDARPGQLWPGERYGDSLPCVHAPKVVKP